MQQKDRGELATLRLRARNGAAITLSALCICDRFHIGTNRIELLGTEQNARAAEALVGHGLVEWDFYTAPGAEAPRAASGRGLLRSVSHARSWHVAPGAVQIIGHIEVFETEDVWRSEPGAKDVSQTYWFLQRPHGWDTDFKRPWRDLIEQAGPWQRLGALGLRFRMKSTSWSERDPRAANEEIRVRVPTIEISPLGAPAADFSVKAARLWSLLRVLIAFRFRQQVIGAVAHHCGPDAYRTLRRPMAIAPQEEPSLGDVPMFRERVDQYLRLGARALWPLADYVEHLHVSVYSYTTTFRERTAEEKLVNGVEGIERLITVLEDMAGVERDLMSRGEWRGIAKSLKAVVEKQVDDEEMASRIKRALSAPPMLSLEERVRRLVERDPVAWGHDARLLRGLGALITSRNHIVHGRRVKDLSALSIHVDRAQLLFERLFLGLVGQAGLISLCYRRPVVDNWDNERANGNSSDDESANGLLPL